MTWVSVHCTFQFFSIDNDEFMGSADNFLFYVKLKTFEIKTIHLEYLYSNILSDVAQYFHLKRYISSQCIATFHMV